MSTTVTWNGTSYSIPAASELNWSGLSTFLIDLGQHASVANALKQTIRLATTTPVTVAAATDFAVLTRLAAPGAVAVNLPAGVDNQIFMIKDDLGDAATNNITITPNGSDTINGGASLVLNHNKEMVLIQFKSGDWKLLLDALFPGTITDADISATAGIARSKIATGTAYRVLANTSTGAMGENAALTPANVIYADTNGQLAGEAALAKSRGGAGADQSSVTYPSTGTIVTTAGTQQLTNKDIDGGTASDSLRITLPKNTISNLNGLTRKEGTVVYASDINKVYADDGSNLVEIGTGSGGTGINYISNPGFEDTSVTGWTSYKNSSVVAPYDVKPDDFGGSHDADFTFAASASSPLRGSYSALLTHTANNRQGNGWYYTFNIDNADALNPKPLNIKFDYYVATGTFLSSSVNTTVSDIVVYIWDVTNGGIIEPSCRVLDGSGTFSAYFQPTYNTTNYRLILHNATSTATPFTMKFDNFSVGPQATVSGVPASDWTAYTPTISGFGTCTDVNIDWKRIADTYKVRGRFTCGTVAASVAKVTLPNGTIASSIFGPEIVGRWTKNNTSANVTKQGTILATGGNNYVTFSFDGYNTTNDPFADQNGNTIADTGNVVEINFEVPITGLSANVAMSSDADTRVVAARYSVNDGDSYDVGGITLDFADKNYDTHNAVSGANSGAGGTWKFNVPVSGKYRVSSAISFANGAWVAGNVIYLDLWKNGSHVSYIASKVIEANVTNLIGVNGSDTIDLVVGDYIQMNVLHNRAAGALALINDATYNFICIERQAGPATIAASEVVKFNAERITSNSSNFTSETQVTFNSTIDDTHGAYNSSTGIFTAPMPGKYNFNVAVRFQTTGTAASNVTLKLRKGASTSVATWYFDDLAASKTYMATINRDVNLLAGDTIDVTLAAAAQNILYLFGDSTYFSGHRIGGIQ